MSEKDTHISQYFIPWALPEEWNDRRVFWIGASSPFNPQLQVVDGPSAEEIKAAYKEAARVSLKLESRTADMDEDSPSDDAGIMAVTIV